MLCRSLQVRHRGFSAVIDHSTLYWCRVPVTCKDKRALLGLRMAGYCLYQSSTHPG